MVRVGPTVRRHQLDCQVATCQLPAAQSSLADRSCAPRGETGACPAPCHCEPARRARVGGREPPREPSAPRPTAPYTGPPCTAADKRQPVQTRDPRRAPRFLDARAWAVIAKDTKVHEESCCACDKAMAWSRAPPAADPLLTPHASRFTHHVSRIAPHPAPPRQPKPRRFLSRRCGRIGHGDGKRDRLKPAHPGGDVPLAERRSPAAPLRRAPRSPASLDCSPYRTRIDCWEGKGETPCPNSRPEPRSRHSSSSCLPQRSLLAACAGQWRR